MSSSDIKLPEQWCVTKLDDIYQIFGGGTPTTSKPEYWGGETPWITSADIEGVRAINIRKYVTEKGIENSTTTKAPKNSLLVVTRVGLGKIAIIKEETCFSQDLQALVMSNELLVPEYTLYLFSYKLQSLKFEGRGTTISGLTKKQLKDLEYPLPPFNEQHRIVAKIEELIEELDKGIESLKTAREQLKVYRQALLKQAFEGKLTERWREENADRLESAEQLLERIKQEREARYQQQLEDWKAAVKQWEESGKNGKKPPKPRNLPNVKPENEGKPIEGLPKSWHCLKLVDIVLSLGQGWSPKCNNIPAGESEWGVIKTTAIQHLSYLEAENKQLPVELVPRPWLSIQKDDILITRAGPRKRVGVVCRVSETRDKLMLCDKAYRMQFPDSEISPTYVESLLNTEDFKRKIEALKTGISDSGVNITQPRLLGLYFPVPPIEEQLEIGKLLDERLSVIERNVSDIDDALKQSKALRQSILKKAFSGQLVPQDPDDEPASVLLDRIAKEKEEAAAKAKKAKATKKKPKTTRTSTRKAS